MIRPVNVRNAGQRWQPEQKVEKRLSIYITPYSARTWYYIESSRGRLLSLSVSHFCLPRLYSDR